MSSLTSVLPCPFGVNDPPSDIPVFRTVLLSKLEEEEEEEEEFIISGNWRGKHNSLLLRGAGAGQPYGERAPPNENCTPPKRVLLHKARSMPLLSWLRY